MLTTSRKRFSVISVRLLMKVLRGIFRGKKIKCSLKNMSMEGLRKIIERLCDPKHPKNVYMHTQPPVEWEISDWVIIFWPRNLVYLLTL